MRLPQTRAFCAINFNMNFATPAAIFVSSFVIGLSGALMPGPLLAVAVRDSARSGITAAPLLVLGHGILEAALVALILLGLAEWLKGEAAMAVISLLGGAALLWMAVGMARDARTLRAPAADAAVGNGIERGDEAVAGPGESTDGRVPRRVHGGTSVAEARMAEATRPRMAGSGLRSVLDGIVVSVSNPYWSFWWATVGLAYVVLARSLGAAGIAAFFAGHILSDFAWYMAVGFAVCMGRGRLSDRFYRGVVGCCAACLVLFALWFAYRGLTTLVRLS